MSTTITPPAPNQPTSQATPPVAPVAAAPATAPAKAIDYDTIAAQNGARYPDALAKYPPMVQSYARQLADYTLKLPQGNAVSKLPWVSAIQAAKDYDPSFDMKQYEARQKLLDDFSAEKQGTTGGAIASANKVIGHLDQLSKSADALNNTSIKPLNWLVNETEKNVTDDPRLNNYTTDAKMVADELTRFFRNSGGSEADIQSKLDSLDPNLGPANQKGAIREIVKLVGSQLGSLRDGYMKTMGKEPAQPLLGANAQAVLTKMGINPSDVEHGHYDAASAPVAKDWMQQAKAAKTGDIIPLPNGHQVKKLADGTFQQLTK